MTYLCVPIFVSSADQARRDAAVVTVVVSASGITLASISASFWGLVAGMAFLALGRLRR